MGGSIRRNLADKTTVSNNFFIFCQMENGSSSYFQIRVDIYSEKLEEGIRSMVLHVDQAKKYFSLCPWQTCPLLEW